MNAKNAVAIFLVASLIGCTQTRYITLKQACPAPPIYPKITDASLKNIDDNTYAKIVDNISLRDDYIEELTVFCGANHVRK